ISHLAEQIAHRGWRCAVFRVGGPNGREQDIAQQNERDQPRATHRTFSRTDAELIVSVPELGFQLCPSGCPDTGDLVKSLGYCNWRRSVSFFVFRSNRRVTVPSATTTLSLLNVRHA